jgi:uncharacterized protein (DUF1697 family)
VKEINQVCFLRAINVLGKNMIKMAVLKDLFKSLGFKNIETYLQSGNVIFSRKHDLGESDVTTMITTAIRKKLGLDVRVLFRDLEDLEIILRNNPFVNRDNADIERLYLTLLEKKPPVDKLDLLQKDSYLPERYEASHREIYLHCPDGYGRAKLNNNFLEKKLGVMATTRNWKTMNAVYNILKDI